LKLSLAFALVLAASLQAQAPNPQRAGASRPVEPYRVIGNVPLNPLLLPFSPREYPCTDQGQGRERYHYGPEHSMGAEARVVGQNVGQRNLQQPETAEIDQRRRPRVPGSVQRIGQDHSIGVEEESKADSAQARNRVGGYCGSVVNSLTIGPARKMNTSPIAPRKSML
jgi:hypothetical protein